MSKLPAHITVETLCQNFSDTTEGLYGFKWQHYDLLSALRADAMIEGMNATDFRLRAAYQLKEQLLFELMGLIQPYMAPSEQTGRTAGDVWLEEKALDDAEQAQETPT